MLDNFVSFIIFCIENMSDSPENLESASEGRSHNYSDSAEFEIKDKNKKLLDAAGEGNSEEVQRLIWDGADIGAVDDRRV